MNLVTHFIAGYPDAETSIQVALGMIEGGATALEMQIPFSDPSADGPIIENACRQALNGGFKMYQAFDILKILRSQSDIPIFVMSYASLVVSTGVDEFVKKAKDSGASGLIVPDLPPDQDEGLFDIAARVGCPAIPILVPTVPDLRLKAIFQHPFEWVYVALRSGITGNYTELGEYQTSFLEKLNQYRNTRAFKVMAGFGIQNRQQVSTINNLADAAIVGSALVKTIGENGPSGCRKAVRDFVVSLV